MSNRDIEITLERKVEYITDFPVDHIFYVINIKNKSNRTLYIDKAFCYKIFNDGTSMTYFENNEQISVSKGGGSGASLGLGSVAGAMGIGGIAGQLAEGIGIGGGNSHSVSTVYNKQRVISIPPGASRLLSEEKFVNAKEAGPFFQSSGYVGIEYAESFDFEELAKRRISNPGGGSNVDFSNRIFMAPKLQPGLVNKGEVKEYTHSNSPFTQGYVVTYSNDSNFATYSTLKLNVFIKEIIGCEKYRKNNGMTGKSKIQSEKYIEGINNHTLEGFYSAE